MLPEMTSISGQMGGAANKLTKAKGKVVKPILKKLSQSPKNSLDLDRGWDEQPIEQLESSGYVSSRANSVRDGNFGYVDAGNVAMVGGGSSVRAAMSFHHGRSGSQASTGSGPRGAFIHPFAQAPRTSTPPLSYANSRTSFDANNSGAAAAVRDYSPTITENEDDEEFDTVRPNPSYASHINSSSSHNLPSRPSLQSQRTSSYEAPTPKAPSLRINTTGGSGRSVSGTTVVSRLAHGSTISTTSQSDLHLTNSISVSVANTTIDSPTGSICGVTINNSSSGTTQMSPLRSSLDMAGFPRLRSRSEMDTVSRAENIRAARRKFEEREKIKEEKYDREMIKKRERRDTKEAARIEKGETIRTGIHRKNTGSSLGSISSPKASTFSRKGASWTDGAGYAGHSSRNDLSAVLEHGHASAPVGGVIGRRHTDSPSTEKHMGFMSRKYETVPLEIAPVFVGPGVDEVRFEPARPRRTSKTKRRTQGYWQEFLLWLRTKLLRLSGR
ncbi:hypothetical protein QBC38DRAFT_506945 [Podospora fimiseda]|uniref:Uncharacterized protein n=1 Tax=Podospora fimiseda TaxID=252190 RepID=A0AAN7H7T1_9PEZI|nr:hypothetical protein QBC38DRAFT_506945 [Podospora fimiseda]